MAYKLRYRFMDCDTGLEVSSAENVMSNVTKRGSVTLVNTTGRRVSVFQEVKGCYLEVATHKHDNKWVYVKERKDTFSIGYRIRGFINKLKGN
jgi:hypothetical protein